MKPSNISSPQWWQYNMYFVLEHLLGDRTRYIFLDNAFSKLNNEILDNLSSSKGEHLASEVLQPLSTEKKEVQALKNVPLLYRNAAKNWTACKKWSFEYFSEKYGDQQVIINTSKGIVDPKAPQVEEEISLRTYIDQIKQGTRKYLKLSNLAEKEKSLQKDVDIHWLRKLKKNGSFGEKFYMFMGGEGTKTPMHNEFPTTVYIQVSGKKRWVLYKTSDRLFIHAKATRRTYFTSDFNPDDPDYHKFPMAKYAQKYEVVLNPGDVLLVPPLMWHYVVNETDSIGIAFKFANILESLKSSKLLTSLFFLSTNPNIFYSFFASRIKKDDYVLMKK